MTTAKITNPIADAPLIQIEAGDKALWGLFCENLATVATPHQLYALAGHVVHAYGNERRVRAACSSCGVSEITAEDAGAIQLHSGTLPRSPGSARCTVCGWSATTADLADVLFKSSDRDKLKKAFPAATPRHQQFFAARHGDKIRADSNLMNAITGALPAQHDGELGLIAIDAYRDEHVVAALHEDGVADWPWTAVEVDAKGRPYEVWHPRRPLTATEASIYSDASAQRKKQRQAEVEREIERVAQRLRSEAGL